MVENEIQFLSWEKFHRMGPSIVQLEISRLERLRMRMIDRPALHNALVRARFELMTFVERLEESEQDSLEVDCAPHLRAAIIAISVDRDELTPETAEALDYVADRLAYVHDRMVLLY